ncbi:hypothetical protein ABPG75_005121 [Micractinium tetrahymenae]
MQPPWWGCLGWPCRWLGRWGSRLGGWGSRLGGWRRRRQRPSWQVGAEEASDIEKQAHGRRQRQEQQQQFKGPEEQHRPTAEEEEEQQWRDLAGEQGPSDGEPARVQEQAEEQLEEQQLGPPLVPPVGGPEQKRAPQQEQQRRERQAARPRCRSLLGLPILRPDSAWVRAWDGCMSLLDLTYTAYLVPLSVAFDNMEGAHFTWFNVVNIVGTALYVGDILMGFHTGFIAAYDVRRALVMEGPKVAHFYIWHGHFLTDAIATMPIIPEIVATSAHTDTTAIKWLYMLRLLRLARVFRLLKVWGGGVFTDPLSRGAQRFISTAGLYLINLVLALSILVNLLGCIWWFIAELEGLENSWASAAQLKTSLLDATHPAQWAASIYFAMTTMTTVGYGDITPQTPAEQLVAVCFMATAVFYFGWMVNFLGDLLHSSRKAQQADVLRHKLEGVEAWMQASRAERHLPGSLQGRVRRYFVQVWAPHAGIDDTEHFEDLPIHLRGEIVRAMAGDALRCSSLFRLLSEQMRAQMADAALPVRLVAGHNLFEEGDEAGSFYVLQEGEAVALRGTHRVHALHGPALVGQAAVFSHYVPECRQRLHTVRAVTNCTLWEFRGGHLAKLLKGSPAFLPPLCESYLQYLTGLQRRIQEKGQPVPKRVQRIEREVQALANKARAKVELRRLSSAGEAAGLTPSLPASPEASPPGSPRVFGSGPADWPPASPRQRGLSDSACDAPPGSPRQQAGSGGGSPCDWPGFDVGAEAQHPTAGGSPQAQAAREGGPPQQAAAGEGGTRLQRLSSSHLRRPSAAPSWLSEGIPEEEQLPEEGGSTVAAAPPAPEAGRQPAAAGPPTVTTPGSGGPQGNQRMARWQRLSPSQPGSPRGGSSSFQPSRAIPEGSSVGIQQ